MVPGRIPGGLAEGIPERMFDQEQLAMGIEVELEHTDDPELAREIAKDHLAEQIREGIPQDYYTRLARMEREMKANYAQVGQEVYVIPERSVGVVIRVSPLNGAARYTIRMKDGRKIDAHERELGRHMMFNPEVGMEPNRKWTQAYKNRLPDSAFLWVSPGGRKDDDGRTHPLSLRHLPYKDLNGRIDITHLRNAIARLATTTSIPEAHKPAIKKRACQLLEREGGHCATEKYRGNRATEGYTRQQIAHYLYRRKFFGMAPEDTERYVIYAWMEGEEPDLDTHELESALLTFQEMSELGDISHDDAYALLAAIEFLKEDMSEARGTHLIRNDQGDDLLRDVRLEAEQGKVFRLLLFDTGQEDRRGQSILAYRLVKYEPDGSASVIFDDSDFAGSPIHADDSDATLRSLLGFLTLRRGDVESAYFDSYTPEQMVFSEMDAEALAMYALDPEPGYPAMEFENWEE